MGQRQGAVALKRKGPAVRVQTFRPVGRSRRPARRSGKFNARRTEYRGRIYASRAEARRAAELDVLVRVGEVVRWEAQPEFVLVVNGERVCKYRADFRVHWTDGRETVEDVKGVRTAVYRLKRKLMKACHGIEIVEVHA